MVLRHKQGRLGNERINKWTSQGRGRAQSRLERGRVSQDIMTPAQRLTHAFFVIKLCAIPFSLASGSSCIPGTNLRLRGGSGTMQYTSTQAKQTQVDSLLEGERKPDLKKTSSRLILEEMQVFQVKRVAGKITLFYRTCRLQ